MKKQDIRFVIVIYGAATDVLRQLLGALQGWPVELVDNTKKNVGYGAGANMGMKKAFKEGAQWVVVMNQDIEVSREGISQFCAMAQNCDPGIIGPEAGGLDPKRWTTILPARGSVAYISGSMMAIHRNVWERVGGFFESYFMYYEDADLCVRATRAGFRLTLIPVDGFRHRAHGNEFYLARNHLWFVLRNAPLRVKLYELLRLPKTLFELWS